MNRIYLILQKLLAGIVCLFVALQPVYVYAETVVYSFGIGISVTIEEKEEPEPDHTLPFQYIGEKNGYLWKPIVPNDAISADQVAPLPGNYWVPVGIWGSVSGKDVDTIEGELAGLGSLEDFSSDSLAVSFYWNEIEAVEDDEFTWANGDKLLEEVDGQGRKVFVVIHIDPPPGWLDFELLSDNHLGEKSNKISYVHPETEAEVKEFVETLVSRYAVGGIKQDLGTAIAGWILYLGEGYVDGDSGTYIGYEHQSVTEFQYWLEDKYDSIDKLKNAWAKDNEETPGYLPGYPYNPDDGFTNVDMPVPFDDIGEFIAGNKASWYDLIQWREDTIVNWVKEIVGKIREIDLDLGCLKEEGENRHLISVLTLGEEPGDSDWQYSGINIQEIAEACSAENPENNPDEVLLDFWSIVCSPSVEEDSEAISSQWQLVRTRARSNLPVMVLQLQVDSDDEELQKKVLKTNMWEFIYGGALGVHVYDGEDTIDITSAPYAAVNEILGDMAALTMDITNQQDEIVAQMGLTEYLVNSEPAVPEVGFLETEAQHTVFNSFEAEIYSLYGPLKRLGFQPGFINEETFIYDIYNINNIYNSIILPQSKKLSDDVFWLDEEHLFSRLRDVLDADMKLLASAELPGLMDDYGKVRHTPQPDGELWSSWRTNIEEIFGVDANSGEVDDLIATNEEDVLAYFPNDSPALVAKDSAAISLYSLSSPDGEWDWSSRYDWLKLIYVNEEAFGLEPVISVSNSPYVWMDYRTGPFDSVLVYLHNYVNVLQTIELKSDLLLNKKITLLLSGDVLSEYTESNKVGINIGPQDEVFLLATLASPPPPPDDGAGGEGDLGAPDAPDGDNGPSKSGEDDTTGSSNTGKGSTSSSSGTGETTGSSGTAQSTTGSSTGTETGQETGGAGSYSVIVLERDNKKDTTTVSTANTSFVPTATPLAREPYIRTTIGSSVIVSENEREEPERVTESSEIRELPTPVFRRGIGSQSPQLQTTTTGIQEPATYISYSTRKPQFSPEAPTVTKEAVKSTSVIEDPLVRYVGGVIQRVIDFISNLGNGKDKSAKSSSSLAQRVSKYVIGMVNFSVPRAYRNK